MLFADSSVSEGLARRAYLLARSVHSLDMGKPTKLSQMNLQVLDSGVEFLNETIFVAFFEDENLIECSA